MSGIFGHIKKTDKSQLEKMIKVMDRYKKAKLVYNFENSDLGFAQVSLDLYDKNRISDEDYELVIEGTCYNLSELNKIHNTDFEYFSEIILWSYKNDLLKQLLNKADGCFHFSLYDKKYNKLIISNDRFGLRPLFVYLEDNNFAFSSEVKSLITLDFVNKEINNLAFEMFYDLGYLLGTNTWFKYIKRLKPATLIEYDIFKHTLIQTRYWTFGEIKKSNMSFDEAVDKAYEIFNQGIKRIDLNLNPMISLSAGFDSRLIFACFVNNFPEYKPYVVTFGIPNCQDIVTAQKVCDIANIKNNIRFFNKDIDWFSLRKILVYNSDCSFSLRDMHGLEFLDEYPDSIKINLNGYLGDTVLGHTYLPNDKRLYNKRPNYKLAYEYYGEWANYSEYDDEYFNIENPIVLQWFNRGLNFINEAQVLCYNNIDVFRPFFTKDLVEFIASLPNEYLEKDKLYNHVVLKYLPKYFKNINRNSNKPICIKKDFDYYIRKIKYLFNKFIKGCGIVCISKRYINYPLLLRKQPLYNEIKDLMHSKTALFYKYINIDPDQLLFDIDHIKAGKILSICSIEVYFEQINYLSKAKVLATVERE